MIKRVITGILAFTMVFALLTGCTESNEPNTQSENTEVETGDTKEVEDKKSEYGDTGGLTLPIVDKPITLSACGNSTNPNLNESWFIEELERRTGIKLELKIIAASQWQDKINMMLASGNITDIFPAPKEQINVLGTLGAIVPVNEYAEILPNFKKNILEKYPWVMKSYTAENGNLYYYPTFDNTRDVNHGVMYRKDIFDKHGIEPWKNTEEFYEALVKLKELYPDSYPWASKYKERIFWLLSHGWGMSGTDFNGEFPVFYDEEEGLWKFVAAQSQYKDMLMFLQKLYKEKLLDPEFLTDTAASWTAKMTTGKSMVTWDWIGRMEMWHNQVKDQMPEFDLRYGYPIGPEAKIMKLVDVQSTGNCVKNTNNKEAALKLLDYLASPSGKELATMGQEGVTYNTDADGNINYVGFEKDAIIGINDLEERWGLFIQPVYPTMDSRSVYFKFSEREQEAQDMMINNKMIEEQDPILKFTAEEQERIAELKAVLDKATTEFSSLFVLDSSKGDTEWNEWIKKAEELKFNELTDIYNAAQKRYNERN